MPDLSFVRAKIDRAYVHLKAADAISKPHCESDFYGLKVKPYRKGRYHLRVMEVTPFPPEFSILLGEIAYQLRSGLDHIAFAFSVPQNRKEEKDVKFPFASRSSDWNGSAKRLLPGACQSALRVFERFQPYHRRREPHVDYLWCINVVNNWEKHRAPATAAASLVKATGTIGLPAEMRARNFKFFPNRAIKTGAILARFDAEKPPPNSEVHINAQHSLTPVFDYRMTGVAKLMVFDILEGARIYMRDVVLPAFESIG